MLFLFDGKNKITGTQSMEIGLRNIDDSMNKI